MKKGINAIMVMLIILASNLYVPIVYGQDNNFIDPRERYDLGEVISVNVKNFEPSVVPSSVLEDDNRVVVTAFLEGQTLGSFLGQQGPAIEPLYGEPLIRSISVRTANSSRFVSSVRYVRPSSRLITMSDLGSVQIVLSRVRKESDLPGDSDFKVFSEGSGRINIDLIARIEMHANRLVDFGEQSLLLGEWGNEGEWRNQNLDEFAFWGGRGYIRPVKITSTSVTYDIYDGSLRPIARKRTLRTGETSSPLNSRDFGNELLEDRYRVRLDGILEPGVKTAKLRLMSDGETLGYRVVREGESLYVGSRWFIDSIQRTQSGTNFIDNVILRTKEGDRVQIEKIHQEGEVTSFRDICDVLSDNNYCKAIEEYKGILDSQELDDEGVRYGDKAMYWTARSYEELISVTRDVDLASDARTKAVDAYNKVEKYNKEEARKRAGDLNLPGERSSSGGRVVIVEGEEYGFLRNVEVSLIEINLKGTTSSPPVASVEINPASNGGITSVLKKGDLLSGIEVRDNTGRAYKWIVKEILDDRIQVQKAYTDYAGQVTSQQAATASDIRNSLVKYDSYIQKAASDYGVDVNMIRAIIWRESTGNSQAESNKGAVGLMQLLPSTAGDMGGRSYTKKELKDDVATNIDLGTKYFKFLLNRYNQNMELALAAYNWGLDNVDKKCNSTIASCNFGINTETPNYLNDILGYRAALIGVGDVGGDIVDIRDNNRPVILDQAHNVKLISIDLNKQALFTILPGDGRALYSESEFSLHIPIEKRAIQLTPERIDKEINKTQERLEKLEKSIVKLEDFVTKWKTLCLATFAYLTMKNSFFSGFARSDAREQVMERNLVEKDNIRGAGWKEYCANAVQQGKNGYKTIDQCISANAGEITEQIDQAEITIKKVNSALKDVDDLRDADSQQALSRALGDGGLDQKKIDTLVRYNQLTPEDTRELIRLKENGDTEAYNKLLADKKIEADRWAGYEEIADRQFSQEDLKTPENQRDKKALIVALDNLDRRETADLTEKSKVSEYLEKNYPNANRNSVVVLDNVNVDKDGGRFTYAKDGLKIDVSQVLEQGKPVLDDEGRMIFSNGANNQLYLVSEIGDLRNTYANPAQTIEYNKDFTPYIIPMQDTACTQNKADYIEVKHTNGQPIEFNIYNVGPNGRIDVFDREGGVGDDKLHFSNIAIERDQRLSRCVESRYGSARLGRVSQGQSVNVAGRNYIASLAASRLRDDLNTPRCTDVMDPKDCRILFNVCDPVMCPISRFNLGGEWQLAQGDSVAATGIIGSLVLGLPNWGKENTIPPICVTGVLAGMKNIRSNLQGYEQCLLAAKVRDENVGICDRVRSVFMCEVLWREALAIFKVKGSLVGLVSKGLGQTTGGGEYLTFQNSVQNAGDSVEFFTREYASSAFAAYQSRSTAEIGTEICKSAIYGQFPGIGNFVDELSRPENPTQFTAVLSTMPWSDTQKKSRYNIFYHIYAGSDVVGINRGERIRYSVFLRNPSMPNRIFYATERCDQGSSTIPLEQYATHSVDCIGDEGFTEVCVTINGRTRCGFGKVSTGFALNYVNDQVVANEVRKEINKAEDCKPDDPRYSSSVGSLIAGNPGVLNSGVVRFCGVQNPGSGTNPDDWARVGDCGYDEGGRYHGSCWMDKRSIDIKHLSTAQGVLQDLDERGYNLRYGEDSLGYIDDAAESSSSRGITIDKISGDINLMGPGLRLNGLFNEQTLLLDHYDSKIVANARFLLGMIYWNYGRKGSIPDKEVKPLPFELEASHENSLGGLPANAADNLREVLGGSAENIQKDDPATCKLEAFWEKTAAVEPEVVNLIVRGSRCEGLKFNVEIYDNDLVTGSDFVLRDGQLTISNNVGTYPWVTEHKSDDWFGFTDADFRARITYEDSSYGLSAITSNQLEVLGR